MANWKEWVARAGGFFRRGRMERRIAEETEFHLEMLAAKHEQRGLSRKDAMVAARREFGRVSQMQEDYRGQGSLPFFEALWSDMVFAKRSMAKAPGVTALIVATLGLGIGANTAIFSFVNEVMLRPLPYRDADRLVEIGREWRGRMGASAPRDFALIRDKSRSFEAVGTMFLHRGENVETPGSAQHVVCLAVSEGYFRALGVEPQLGRTFLKEEDIPNGPKVVVLSHEVWLSAFGGARDAAGKAIKIGGVPHTVVGVMPRHFSTRARARLWVPLQTNGLGNDTNYTMVGRLATGVTAMQAQAEVDALLAVQDRGYEGTRRAAIVLPLQQTSLGEFRQPVLLLFGGVCIVLLVSCLNVANLLLSRSAARAREVAVRAALGAGRWRLMRQMLTESTLLAAMGCLAGVLAGHVFVWGLGRLTPFAVLREVSLDRTALLFTVGVSFLAGVGFGLAPALHSLRLRLNDVLKESGGKASAARSVLRGRRVLVVVQVALCMVLSAGAGLLIRSILNLRAVEMGFSPANLLVAPMALNTSKLESKEALLAYYEQALERVRSIPGVANVAITTQLPVEGQFNLPVELPESAEPDRTRSMQFRIQTRDAFSVLGMRLVRGREFTQSDRAGAPPAAIVNEAFAREFFPGQEVLGKQITMRRFSVPDVWTVCGVINDVREMGLKRPAPPAIYALVDQTPQPVLKLVHRFVPAKWIIRVRPGMNDAGGKVRQAVSSLDPSQPFQQFEWMESIVSQTMQMERFLMVLLGAFAMLTLAMVASGLYGTLAYAVVARQQEIGIRMALGARAGTIAAMVVRSGFTQVAVGLLIGVMASYWTNQAMAGWLFGLPPMDPFSLTAAATVLLAVGAVAGLGPSLSAARTDPVRTLRVE